MHTIEKEFLFEASHRLVGLPGDHPCSRLHGHSYRVIIRLQSETLDDTGFVRDYRNLDCVKKFLDERFDHRHLNDVLQINPTAENIAEYIFNRFRESLPELAAVTVKETTKTSATYQPV